jgi:ElaA protein
MTEHDVRTARFDELDTRTSYLLWQLRESVFVVEQNCPYPELDGRDLEPGTTHVWVEDGGEPVGYLRVLADGEVARIGRVLVAKTHRGRGLAETLLTTALDVVGDRPSRLDAQSYLAQWYTRFGYEQTGEAFVEDGIPHVPMSRQAPSGSRQAASGR